MPAGGRRQNAEVHGTERVQRRAGLVADLLRPPFRIRTASIHHRNRQVSQWPTHGVGQNNWRPSKVDSYQLRDCDKNETALIYTCQIWCRSDQYSQSYKT